MEGHRYVDRQLVRRTFLAPDAFAFDPDAARAALGDVRDAILCEEDLSGVLHNGLASGLVGKEVASRLRVTLPEARVVILVRAQTSAAVSWYLQYLREGGTASIDRYLFPEGWRHLGHDRPYKWPRFHWSQLEWSGLIRHYDALFGADRVLVLPYELLRRDRDALLARMEAALGITLPRPADARVNEGYRRGALPLLRAANLFTARSVVDKRTLVHIPYWYTIRKALFGRVNRLPIFGGFPRADHMLSGRARAWIAGRFAESNRWLAERTGENLRALGYPLDPPPAPVEPPSRSRALAWIKN